MSSDILIRAAEKRDIADLTEMQLGDNYMAGTLQLPHPSSQLWEQRLNNPSDNRHNLVAVIDEKVVGHLGLTTNPRPRRKHTAGIGMGVNDDYAGRGVGTALMAACIQMADNWLNITRLELTVFHDNAPAISLYTKFGFEHEGRFKQYAFRKGAYVDVLAMARIRPGFERG